MLLLLGNPTLLLRWSIEIYSADYDGNGNNNFEPYGELRFDFAGQKDIKLWELLRIDYLSVRIGTSTVISGNHILSGITIPPFSEKMTLRGQVMEADIDADDVMGNYDGKSFTLPELRDGQTFYGQIRNDRGITDTKNSYVKVNITIDFTCKKVSLMDLRRL